MANKILSGYDQPWGDKKIIIVDHFGPSSYSNVSTSVGTGDVVNASDFGIGGFDFVAVMPVSPTADFWANVYAALMGSGNAVPSVVLRWFSYPAAATTGAAGAEVANTTDLSAKSVRLLIVGV